MCIVIWPDWPWPSPPLDPPAPPPPPAPSERPDQAPVSHPDLSVPQKRPNRVVPSVPSSQEQLSTEGRVTNREVLIWAGVVVVALAVLIILHPHPLWVAAGCIVIGTALIVRAPALPGLPAKELGTAVLIAGFLALTLDRYLRRSAIEEVMKGVAPYYMTFGLPQQLADEVVYLRGVQLVRKNPEIKVSLKQEGTNPDSLTFETEMSYTLVNYSNDAHPFPFRAGATGGARRALLLQAAASGSDLGRSQYDTTFTPSTQPSEVFERWIKIPPNKNDPNNRFVVRTRGPKHADDSETIFLVDSRP